MIGQEAITGTRLTIEIIQNDYMRGQEAITVTRLTI